MTEPGYIVRPAHWPEDTPLLKQVRETVFVIEQAVPRSLEWDGIDADCEHVLAMDTEGKAIGTGRLLPDGHIGRMAVLLEWRGRGVGSSILQALITRARDKGVRRLVLNAQVAALSFYARFGFTAVGEIFQEAGIPHREMVRDL